MQFRKIGSLDVSVVGLGSTNFGQILDDDVSIGLIQAALDLDINFIDTANVYGRYRSEEVIGKAIAGRRDKTVIATKFGKILVPGGGQALVDCSPAQVHSAINESLQRLDTDYVDLYLLHAPDPNTPITETLVALNELIDAGKVLEIGCCAAYPALLQEAKQFADENGLRSFVNVQNRYNLLHGERPEEKGILRTCEEMGVTFVPYSALAFGMLTGKYRRGTTPLPGSQLVRRLGDHILHPENLLDDEYFDVVENLTAFAADHGHALLELAFAGLLARPVFSTIIAGVSTPAQLATNVSGSDWNLSLAEYEQVRQIAGLDD